MFFELEKKKKSYVFQRKVMRKTKEVNLTNFRIRLQEGSEF
jgi:hypothetical protein